MKSQSHTVTSKRAQRKSPPRTAGAVSTSPRTGNGDARTSAPSPVDAVKRHMLIAQAAYYRAEKRGFATGGELQDWLEAEAEIKKLLGQ